MKVVTQKNLRCAVPLLTPMLRDRPRRGYATGSKDSFVKQIDLNSYLKLDDHCITEFVKACESSSDKVLAPLGSALLNRQLFKACDVSHADRQKAVRFATKASEEVKKEHGDEYEFFWCEDNASDTPYKPYNFDPENQDSMIFVENAQGKKAELSSVSSRVQELQKKDTLERYYFPEVLRTKIQKIATAELGDN